MLHRLCRGHEGWEVTALVGHEGSELGHIFHSLVNLNVQCINGCLHILLHVVSFVDHIDGHVDVEGDADDVQSELDPTHGPNSLEVRVPPELALHELSHCAWDLYVLGIPRSSFNAALGYLLSCLCVSVIQVLGHYSGFGIQDSLLGKLFVGLPNFINLVSEGPGADKPAQTS